MKLSVGLKSQIQHRLTPRFATSNSFTAIVEILELEQEIQLQLGQVIHY